MAQGFWPIVPMSQGPPGGWRGHFREIFAKRTRTIAKHLIALTSLTAGDFISGNFPNSQNVFWDRGPLA